MRAETRRNAHKKKKEEMRNKGLPREIMRLQLQPLLSGRAPVEHPDKCHGIQVRSIPIVGGVGVFATESFSRRQVLVRYVGDKISIEEGERRHEERRKCQSFFLLRIV